MNIDSTFASDIRSYFQSMPAGKTLRQWKTRMVRKQPNQKERTKRREKS